MSYRPIHVTGPKGALLHAVKKSQNLRLAARPLVRAHAQSPGEPRRRPRPSPRPSKAWRWSTTARRAHLEGRRYRISTSPRHCEQFAPRRPSSGHDESQCASPAFRSRGRWLCRRSRCGRWAWRSRIRCCGDAGGVCPGVACDLPTSVASGDLTGRRRLEAIGFFDLDRPACCLGPNRRREVALEPARHAVGAIRTVGPGDDASQIEQESAHVRFSVSYCVDGQPKLGLGAVHVGHPRLQVMRGVEGDPPAVERDLARTVGHVRCLRFGTAAVCRELAALLKSARIGMRCGRKPYDGWRSPTTGWQLPLTPDVAAAICPLPRKKAHDVVRHLCKTF